MPLCAVGNVGQLACDLLISTLLHRGECKLVGRIYSPALMSVVGPNAYDKDGPPTTSTEVYESEKHKLVIIQQRTSYLKNLRHVYIEELVEWIKDSLFESVIVLSSSFAQCNPDISQLGDIHSSSIRSITTSLFQTEASQIYPSWQSLNVKPLPDRRNIKVVRDGLSFLPGSGITKPLIKAFEKASICAAFLINFCSEGINIQDSYEVAELVDRLLNMRLSNGIGSEKQAGWVEPYSWIQAAEN